MNKVSKPNKQTADDNLQEELKYAMFDSETNE